MRKSRDQSEPVNGPRSGKVLRFDFLYVGDSGTLGKFGLEKGDGFKYILIMMDGLSIPYAPQFVKSELRKFRLDRGVRSRSRKLYGITLLVIGTNFIVKLVLSSFWQ